MHEQINKLIQVIDIDKGKISDDYHTFDELYEHRIILYITLCKILRAAEISITHCSGVTSCDIWRSKTHSDGSSWNGWFLLGIDKQPGFQITYHLPDSYWKDTDFAETLKIAPPFDGHTSKDVLNRLKNI